jgi:hypothetical protein
MKRWNGRKMSHGKKNLERPTKTRAARIASNKASKKRAK